VTEPLNEPLSASADTAYRLALAHCSSPCRDYHSYWQYFRLIGLISSIGGDSSFLLESFQHLARAGARRLLIAAAADYGMLAHVLHAYDAAGVLPEVSVLDRCGTPLALNRWYAERKGVSLATTQADILTFNPQAPFDLLCTHSFLTWLPHAAHAEAVRVWHRALRPGGWLVTAARVREGAPQTAIGFSEPEILAFRQKALKLALPWAGRLAVTPEQIADAAEAYARDKRSHSFASADALRGLLEREGFDIHQFDAGDSAPARLDRPAGPSFGWRSGRYRIVARRV